MSGVKKSQTGNPEMLDKIEREVFSAIKPYGFRKHGRALHRFVSGDISQVIEFHLGQAYREETYLLGVGVGIRVPECERRSFAPEEKPKKFYHDYACNIRSEFGTIEGKRESVYNLHKRIEPILEDILRQTTEIVIPAFEALNSREAILEKRRDYPRFDVFNGHLIFLEEAMIYGRRGDVEKAAELFNRHYHLFGSGQLAQKDPDAIRWHLKYLDELAAKLGIKIVGHPRKTGDFVVFCRKME